MAKKNRVPSEVRSYFKRIGAKGGRRQSEAQKLAKARNLALAWQANREKLMGTAN